MSGLGLVMFAVAIVLMIATGLPVYAVLLAVASAFAALGVALGAFEWQLLLALPSRVVGLLEHDLLQALPLYALIGALLNRLPLAGLMHAVVGRADGEDDTDRDEHQAGPEISLALDSQSGLAPVLRS